MDPFSFIYTYLAPALDNNSLSGLFSYTLILIPTLLVAPLVVYWLIMSVVRLLTQLSI